jgi:hypothetical protein
MSATKSSVSVADAARAVGGVLAEGTKLGLGLLESVKLPLPARTCCSCEIPPPCWEPQPAGDVTTRVCAGNTAVLRLHITNCGVPSRKVSVDSKDKSVRVAPASVTIDPFEEELVLVTFDVPANASTGTKKKTIVWVHGCHLHYVRWTVEVVGKFASCHSDVDIEDCPDLVHHWYDHFYCDRPCPHHG